MTVAFLADHPECRDTLAAWYLREWPDLFHPAYTPLHELDQACRRDTLDCTLLGFVDGRLSATAALLAEDVLPLPQYSPWLASVVVAPDARGRGLGRTMVRAAMAHARRIGLPVLHLWTPAHRGFYEKLGWQSVGVHQHGARNIDILRFPFSENPD